MESEAINRLGTEAETWLNRGRRALLRTLLDRYAPVGRVDALEVGAGFGHNLPLLKNGGEVDAAEVSPECWPTLERRPEIRSLYRVGLPGLELDRTYDLICALEVIEHIEDDRAALAWVHDHLRPGGVFIATVPAYQWLFGPHDVANRHYRRYTRGTLQRAMPPGLTVETAGYFNTALFPLATAAKLAFGLKHKGASGETTRDKQSSSLPAGIDGMFFRILEAEASLIGRGVQPPFGLSVYCVARRND